MHLDCSGSAGEGDQRTGRFVPHSRTGGVQQVVDAANKPKIIIK